MSERGDEIDWEIVGAQTKKATTNVFYKAIPEYSAHSTDPFIPHGGFIGEIHNYTIDW
jgi:hypothetical protein